MTKIALLIVIFALPLPFVGCGKSDKQQEPIAGVPGAAEDISGLCSSIEESGLAKQCTVNSRDNLASVMIDSFDDEVARDICADIAGKTTQLTARLSGQWKLQVFSPYRSDKPLATCPLN
jgi:hypothetical protein